MKKLIILLMASLAVVGAGAAELKRHTNLYDKIPAEGYVGYVGVELGAPGSFASGGFSIGATTSHGWMVTPRAFLGAGTGYIANTSFSDCGVIPIFAEGRLYFPSQYMRRIYPHIGARVGAQIATQGGAGGLIQIACGFRVPFNERLALNVEVGPQYATAYEREHGQNQVTYAGDFKSAGMKFSFVGRIYFEF